MNKPTELSDDAILLAFGWFSFGAKATVTSSPPHANMRANQDAIDELLAANLITHEHEQRHGLDRHHFKGTSGIKDLLGSERAKAVLTRALTTDTTGD
jgi:hypothetical protein